MTCTSTQSESVDSLLRLLADSCRRTLLKVLVTGPAEKPIGDVVDQIVAESGAADPSVLDSERITTELHHKHLPAIDEHEVVDYDPERATVTYHPNETLESLLEFLDELETDAQ